MEPAPVAARSAVVNPIGSEVGPAGDDARRTRAKPVVSPALDGEVDQNLAWREHHERASDPYRPEHPRRPAPPERNLTRVSRGPYTSVQVNIDANGDNILGDAANESSIAIDPTDPSRLVIGWRQFDTIESDFRQAGYAYSTDAGRTWTFPGVLHYGAFGSDPVLDAGPDGRIFYSTLVNGNGPNELFETLDGGVTWSGLLSRYGGDKPWLVVDGTNGIGAGNLYAIHGDASRFWRSIDNGRSFGLLVGVPVPRGLHGLTVAPDGRVLGIDASGRVVASETAGDPSQWPVFQLLSPIDWNYVGIGCRPNPGGSSGQPWIAVNPSPGPFEGEVYAVDMGSAIEGEDPGVLVVRSTDGGHTWSAPVRVNDDPPGSGACQWFATMSVAPNGRIDVVWNDTRNSGQENISELFYSSSADGGRTWLENVAVSPPWDSWIGWPNGQTKIGDYYHMRSDEVGASVAYAATFNGEQDIYFLRIGDYDCNENGIGDADDLRDGVSADCNANDIPDECEPDCNGNEVPDDCDVAFGTSEDRDGSGYPDECELLYVDATATGVSDGGSWQDAFTDLQDALLAVGRSAVPRVEIRVAAGVYRPDRRTGKRSASFAIPPGVTVRGGYAPASWGPTRPRDPRRYPTVLSGAVSGDRFSRWRRYLGSSDHVVTIRSAIRPVALDGLTIQDGGGCESIWGHTSRGGGVCITGGTVELTECIIRDNGACSFGAGMFATNAAVAIRRCHFRDNYSRSAGGGIAVWDQARVEIYDSLIENNEASDWGGGVCVSAGSARISRSTITGNHAREGGGVNVRFGGLVEFDSSTVWGNRGELGGEEDQQVFLHDGQVEARYSCIPGAAERFGGVGNFGADPRFVDRLARNYRLQPDSPCINTGDPADQPGIGTRDLDGRPRRLAGRIDVGAYEFGFGDYNGDRVVDLSDYNHWAACASGPEGGPYPDGCEAFDGNADGDVDLADFAQVQPLLGSR
jgi:hypothetical protein